MRQPPENDAAWPQRCVGGEAEPGEDRGRARRRRMRVDVGEPRVHVGQPMSVVLLLGRSQQRGALGVGGEHHIQQALRSVRCLLGEPPDAGALRRRDAALLGAELAGDCAEQRGLAGSVAPNHADPRAGRDLRRRIVDEQAPGNAQGEIIDDKHGAGLWPTASHYRPAATARRT